MHSKLNFLYPRNSHAFWKFLNETVPHIINQLQSIGEDVVEGIDFYMCAFRQLSRSN